MSIHINPTGNIFMNSTIRTSLSVSILACSLIACSEADDPGTTAVKNKSDIQTQPSRSTESGTATAASEYTLDPIWELEGLKNPESVIYDKKRQRLYVTNVDGSPVEKDGFGSVALVSMDGKLLDNQWIIGLDSPKGIAIHNDRLYVADIDTLHEIDIENREIINSYTAEGAEFLNDVTVSNDGTVFVSDMMLNRIYVLRDDQFDVWLESADLEVPNGLHAEAGRLIVGSWGVMTDGFNTAVPGHLKSVDIASGSVTSLGNGEPVGNLDGVEQLDDHHYLVTDWMSGRILIIDDKGGHQVLRELEQGSADHEYIAEDNLVLIPMMNSNRLIAYRLGN